MESRSTARILTILFLFGLFVFIVIQFVGPSIKNPPVTAELQAPSEVKRVLKNSCYDCHSNETRLPWFDRIAPASWLVANDVKEAREHLNFSEIGKLPAAQQKGILYEAINQAQLGAMPLPRYTAIHSHARITAEDIAVLKNYLNPPGPMLAPDEAAKRAADTQYDAWIHTSARNLNVEPTLNGIQFFPGYRDWKVVSTTNRFDNHTLRVISGNEIAMQAIADHKINPWPDGTVFAKIAWAQQVDANGDTKTGSFIQVEFMVKDSSKYASTGGWGYARWRGMDLKPYGKDAAFTSECVGCHNPVRHNDYVYTFPLAGQQ
jgi:hypothetical protein